MVESGSCEACSGYSDGEQRNAAIFEKIREDWLINRYESVPSLEWSLN